MIPKRAARLLKHILGSLAVLLLLAGCQSVASPAARDAFHRAPQFEPILGLDDVLSSQTSTGPYWLVVGDVVEFQLPAIATGSAPAAADKVEKHLSRVGQNKSVNLPVVGSIEAAGKTLGQVEAAVAAAYCPKFVNRQPSIVARIAEYCTIRVSVVGAVRQPGAFELRSNEQSLFLALLKAGGIVPDGAGAISIRRAGKDAQPTAVKAAAQDGTIQDVGLEDGDVVEVQRSAEPVLTVTGLVRKPGVFPYPAGTRLNLAQAVALAGGVDDVADPRTATVFRRTADGQVVSASFSLAAPDGSSNVALRSGDVVTLQHTAATQARTILAHLLRVGAGFNASYGLN